MKKIGLSLLVLFFPVFALAQTDPLNSSYMPVINENAAAYPSNIWITGPLTKVLQNTGSPGTVHWAIIYAAQNEFQSFQVHVHAASAISNLSVTMSSLTNLRTGTVISSATTNIIVYREAYLDITQITAKSNTFYGVTGYYPDILIPAVDPYYHQTTNAFPFSVTSGNNQSAWIDVHIPPSAPSGYYSGTVTVSNGSVILSTMPVVYAVWAWQMSSTATLKSYIGVDFAAMCVQAYGGPTETGCSAYPGATSNDEAVTLTQIDEAVMMLDHRQTMTSEVYPPPQDFTPTSFTSFETNYGPLLNGTPANTQTILPGAKVTTLSPYTNGQTPVIVSTWMAEVESKGWESTIFSYSCDEPPNGCAWSTINSHAGILHSATPGMPALVTTNIANATTNGVLNSIDWMVPIINDMDPQGGSLQRSAYNAWLSGAPSTGPARELWSYQSCESAGTCTDGTTGGSNATWPNYDVDGTPVANRAMEWLTYLHNQTGELYYDGTYCWTGTCGPSGAQTTDPWTSVYYSGGNGDGTLIYPGTQAKIGVSKPIFLPSIRLKMKRDGFQDYEYLHALAAAGQSTLVANEISSWITDSYTFNNSTGATAGTLTAARQALGTALHQLAYPASTETTPITVAITSPITGATVSGTLSLKGTAADSVSVSSVTVAVDGGIYFLALGTASWSYSLTTTAISNGTHKITALATDFSGNTSSAAINVTVNNSTAVPAADYSFDEGKGTVAMDDTGNGHNGTLVNATWTSAGKFGDAVSLNGSSAYVEVPSSNTLTSSDITLSADVLLVAASTDMASVVNRWSQSNDDEYFLGIIPSGQLFFSWHTTGDTSGGTAAGWGLPPYNSVNSNGTVPLKTMTNVAVVRSGTNVSFYINGNLDSTFSNVVDTNPFRNGINTVRIGAQNRGGDARFLNGVVDEVRIYGQAIPQAQIQSDMNTALPSINNYSLSVLPFSRVFSSSLTANWSSNFPMGTSYHAFLSTEAFPNTFLGNFSTSTANTFATFQNLNSGTTYFAEVSTAAAGGFISLGSTMTLAIPGTTIVIDTIPPTVSFIAPDNGARFSGTLFIDVSASDHVGVTKVELFENGNLLGTDLVSPYVFNWDTADFPNTTYTLTAKGYDAAGNVGSASITVYVFHHKNN